MTYSNQITELNNLLDTLDNYFSNVQEETTDDYQDKWELLFELVFSNNISQRIYQLLREMNTRLDYYDPDTTYEEDVSAFYNAFREKMNSLNMLHN